jgi:hypothetical protein
MNEFEIMTPPSSPPQPMESNLTGLRDFYFAVYAYFTIKVTFNVHLLLS